MADLHVQRLRKELESRFTPHMDMSDWQGKPETERQSAFLSRSLAAFALVALEGAADSDAAAAIVDGFDDNGIDAIYYNASESRLVVCQSKWKMNGTGSVNQGDEKKFLGGVGCLVNLELDRFGPRLTPHKATIEAAMMSTDVSVRLVLTYNGQDPLGKAVAQDLQDFLDQNNAPSELFSL